MWCSKTKQQQPQQREARAAAVRAPTYAPWRPSAPAATPALPEPVNPRLPHLDEAADEFRVASHECFDLLPLGQQLSHVDLLALGRSHGCRHCGPRSGVGASAVAAQRRGSKRATRLRLRACCAACAWTLTARCVPDCMPAVVVGSACARARALPQLSSPKSRCPAAARAAARTKRLAARRSAPRRAASPIPR